MSEKSPFDLAREKYAGKPSGNVESMSGDPAVLERRLQEKAEELKEARKKAAAARATAQSLKRKTVPFLASIKNKLKLEDPTKNEQAIKREAEGSEAFNNHIIGLCAAEAEADQLEADVEGLKDQWESIRSSLSYEKALLQEQIYQKGR